MAASRAFAALSGGVAAQAEHIVSQLPEGSEAREAKCHSGGGGGVIGLRADAEAPPPEVYDDEPFYNALLRQLLEDGGGGDFAGGALPKLRHKKRKTDNRQSKGRTLSYEVQAPLAHFMFPVVPERPVMHGDLFSSVFRQRSAAVADGANGVALRRYGLGVGAPAAPESAVQLFAAY